jgi:hypothetical protein
MFGNCTPLVAELIVQLLQEEVLLRPPGMLDSLAANLDPLQGIRGAKRR